jgi:hypothetical protein
LDTEFNRSARSLLAKSTNGGVFAVDEQGNVTANHHLAAQLTQRLQENLEAQLAGRNDNDRTIIRAWGSASELAAALGCTLTKGEIEGILALDQEDSRSREALIALLGKNIDRQSGVLYVHRLRVDVESARTDFEGASAEARNMTAHGELVCMVGGAQVQQEKSTTVLDVVS